MRNLRHWLLEHQGYSIRPGPLRRLAVVGGALGLAAWALLVGTPAARAQPGDLERWLRVEADGFARCHGTVDYDIGMKNFIQNGPRVPAAFLHE